MVWLNGYVYCEAVYNIMMVCHIGKLTMNLRTPYTADQVTGLLEHFEKILVGRLV